MSYANRSPAMAHAEQMIAAIGDANRAWKAVLDGDRRYQFLLSEAVSNRIGFDEETSFEGVAGYHMSPRSPRRRRAMLLAQARLARLFNGARIPERNMLEIIRSRRLERIDRSVATMATEHSEGRIGDIPVLRVGRAA